MLTLVITVAAVLAGLSQSSSAAGTGQTVTIGTASYPLAGVDIARAADALVLYTRNAGQVVAPTNQWGAEIALVNGTVTALRDRQPTGEAAMPVPSGGYVLSGHGAARSWLLANAKVGGTVNVPGTSTTSSVVRIGTAGYALSGTDVERAADALVVYTRSATQSVSPANQWGAEATVVGGTVRLLSDRQSTGAAPASLPAGGYVLSGHGAARLWLLANATVGKAVTLPGATAPAPAPATATSAPTTAPTTGPATATTAPTTAPTAAPATTAPTASPTASPAAPPAAPATATSNLPAKVVGGYLTTWEARNGVTLRSVVDSTSYNLIYVAFALGVNSSSGALQLDLPPGAASPADFKSAVAYANSKGRKVIVSVGGYYDLPGQTSGYNLATTAKVDQFMTSMRAFQQTWGFNGMDWDLEHGDRADKAGIVSASQQMRREFGPTWIICFAPGVGLSSWVGAGGVLDTLGSSGWDAVGEQIYDQGLSESAYQSLIGSRMSALAGKYGASKVLLGNKYKDDSGAGLADPSGNFVDIATTRAALAALRAGGTNIRGAFAWTIQSDSDAGYGWQSSTGVGGDVLSHP